MTITASLMIIAELTLLGQMIERLPETHIILQMDMEHRLQVSPPEHGIIKKELLVLVENLDFSQSKPAGKAQIELSSAMKVYSMAS